MLNVPESEAVAAADAPPFATQPVTCKARGCFAAAIERRLCAEHLSAVREREAERQRASKSGRDLRLALKGPPPVALLSRTYKPESMEEFAEHMNLLHAFIMTQEPDKEEEGSTPSLPSTKNLLMGVDKIGGKWQELRLNCAMGMNLELEWRPVRAYPIELAQKHCSSDALCVRLHGREATKGRRSCRSTRGISACGHRCSKR